MVTKQVETPTELKQAVLKQLGYGKENAIKGDTLAVILGEKNTRHIRLAIRELIREDYAIVGSVTPPYGYYIANTIPECESYLAELKSYLVENALRRRDFKRAARSIMQRGQLKLI